MFSGTVFTKQGEPGPDLQLPRSAWAFYDRVDGRTSAGAIAAALGLSDAETFAAVQVLQSHALIREPLLRYADYRAARDEAPGPAPLDAPPEAPREASPEASDSPPTPSPPASQSAATGDAVPSGDGSDAPTQSLHPSSDAADADANANADAEDAAPSDADASAPRRYPVSSELATQEWRVRTLHFPTLWTWLEAHASNVKDYKNTQAFILMEASDALASIGVSTLDDLKSIERCGDPDVLDALESAVENNLNESIPKKCYQ